MTWKALRKFIDNLSEVQQEETVKFLEPYDDDAELYEVTVYLAKNSDVEGIKCGDPYLSV